MKTPMISVVMPVYNAELYLNEAIDSILAQTYSNFEFIIINDGSTDHGEEIILSYKDDRIVYVKNKVNLQIVESLNKGISLAKGKYIARMDADDISLPERFQVQFDFMESNPDVDICGSWIETFGKHSFQQFSSISHDEIKISLLFNCSIAHPSTIIKKSVFVALKYQEEYNLAEDYALWAEASKQFTFAKIPLVLLYYRYHENQSNLTLQVLQARRVRLLMLKHLEVPFSSNELNKFHRLAEGKYLRLNSIKKIQTKIITANQKSKLFNDTLLRKEINNYSWLSLSAQISSIPIINKIHKLLKKFL